MSRKDNQKQSMPVVNIGTASLFVMLVGLVFAVLSALAVSSAKNDMKLSEQLAAHTTQYYEASNKATEMLLEPDKYIKDDIISFKVSMNEKQSLVVEAKLVGDEVTVTKWQVENTGAWDNDDNLPVLH